MLHHQKIDVTLTPDVMERADVRMVQRSDRARLAFESVSRVGVGRCNGRQHLNRHCSIESRVARAIYLPHTAGANRRDDFVRTETASGREVADAERQRHTGFRQRGDSGPATLEKIAGCLVRLEQRLDFQPQRRIAGTRVGEKADALRRRARRGAGKELLDS